MSVASSPELHGSAQMLAAAFENRIRPILEANHLSDLHEVDLLADTLREALQRSSASHAARGGAEREAVLTAEERLREALDSRLMEIERDPLLVERAKRAFGRFTDLLDRRAAELDRRESRIRKLEPRTREAEKAVVALRRKAKREAARIVEEAKQKAAVVLEEAKRTAAPMVEEAKRQAEPILEGARQEADLLICQARERAESQEAVAKRNVRELEQEAASILATAKQKKRQLVAEGKRHLERERKEAKEAQRRWKEASRAAERQLKEFDTAKRSLTAKVAARDRKLDSVEKKLVRALASKARLSASAKKNSQVSRQLRETAVREKKLRSELERLQRRFDRATPRSRGMFVDLFADRRFWDWLLGSSDPAVLADTPRIATVGNGPLQSDDLDSIAAAVGFELYWPHVDNHDIEVMVVGREGWTEEELEAQIGARLGATLRVYSQEMFALFLATGQDPLLGGEDLLMGFACEHPALQYLMSSPLAWPAAEVADDDPLDISEITEAGLAEESPLHKMGYAVGVTRGLSRKQRRELLGRAYRRKIPDVGSRKYMEQWGEPRTRRRLWRIAHHLAWLAAFHGRNPTHATAVRQWLEDLRWLRTEYYEPRLRFRWPDIDVY